MLSFPVYGLQKGSAAYDFHQEDDKGDQHNIHDALQHDLMDGREIRKTQTRTENPNDVNRHKREEHNGPEKEYCEGDEVRCSPGGLWILWFWKFVHYLLPARAPL